MKISKNIKDGALEAMKSAAKRALIDNANSTTCMIVHQPKAPASLKQFSRIEDDK